MNNKILNEIFLVSRFLLRFLIAFSLNEPDYISKLFVNSDSFRDLPLMTSTDLLDISHAHFTIPGAVRNVLPLPQNY